jgi:BirA family biotin operon repressor/biotin-[acetyl-CoA-carboxylase] ligase
MKIGHKILRLDTVDSTNNYTANLIKEGKINHGTVILADEQTAGRGQRGAVWASQAGENLLLSLYVSPDNLSVDQQVSLTHFASICVVEFLRKIGISAEVKWPNDIYVNSKKIAGILIENVLSSGKIAHSIIGIGLNVNQQDFDLSTATSIRKEKNEFFPIEQVLFSLINEFNSWWDILNHGDLKRLKEYYLSVLYLLNKESHFEDENGSFKGTIKGISEDGHLIVDKSGEIKKYDLKEIKFIDQSIS